MNPHRILAFIALQLLTYNCAYATLTASELPGGVDNRIVSRYAGSVLQNSADETFASIRIPQSAGALDSSGKLSFPKSRSRRPCAKLLLHWPEGALGPGNISQLSIRTA